MRASIITALMLVAAFVWLAHCTAEAQTLILPSMPRAAVGQGNCADRRLLIASDAWRIRKGRTLTVRAAQPFDEEYQWKYNWIIDNAKIISGHGTREIKIKAGSAKTKGFINADGFIRIRLTVESIDGSNCSLSAAHTIMIGEHHEFNGHPDVEDVVLGVTEVKLACKQESSILVDVKTVFVDPENDVVSFTYLVTAGKIVGVGANVRWNLTGTPPGQHRIAVGVDDGWGIAGRTMAKTVLVKPCVD